MHGQQTDRQTVPYYDTKDGHLKINIIMKYIPKYTCKISMWKFLQKCKNIYSRVLKAF